MIVPDVQKYGSYRDYFRDFLQANRESDRKYSHRYFARKLEWQTSFFADLVSDRRKLSVGRALEFAKFCRMDRFDTERMIYLSLRDSDDSYVAKHFDKLLMTTEEIRQQHVTEDASGRPLDSGLALMFDFLQWTRRILPSEDVCRILYTYTDLTPGKVEALTTKLIENGLIEIVDGGTVKFLQDDIVQDDKYKNSNEFASFHKTQVQNFVRWCDRHKGPAVFFSGNVQLSRAKMDEVHRKFFQFRNWILEIGQEAAAASNEPTAENVLCQFSGHIFPLVDIDHLRGGN